MPHAIWALCVRVGKKGAAGCNNFWCRFMILAVVFKSIIRTVLPYTSATLWSCVHRGHMGVPMCISSDLGTLRMPYLSKHCSKLNYSTRLTKTTIDWNKLYILLLYATGKYVHVSLPCVSVLRLNLFDSVLLLGIFKFYIVKIAPPSRWMAIWKYFFLNWMW